MEVISYLKNPSAHTIFQVFLQHTLKILTSQIDET